MSFQKLSQLPRQLREIASHPNNRNRPISALFRWARWQISSRIAMGPTIIPFVGNTVLIARAGEAGATANLFYGMAEYEDMSFLLTHLKPADRFVDVGANIGAYSILASGVVGCRSIAFEPTPETAKRLRANVRINDLQSLVQVRECAIANRTGSVGFVTDSDTCNHISAKATTSVPVDTLDNQLRGFEPTAIKIDVEVGELDVLQGASAALASKALSTIFIETKNDGKVEAYLKQHGFAIRSYSRASNAIFLR